MNSRLSLSPQRQPTTHAFNHDAVLKNVSCRAHSGSSIRGLFLTNAHRRARSDSQLQVMLSTKGAILQTRAPVEPTTTANNICFQSGRHFENCSQIDPPRQPAKPAVNKGGYFFKCSPSNPQRQPTTRLLVEIMCCWLSVCARPRCGF